MATAVKKETVVYKPLLIRSSVQNTQFHTYAIPLNPEAPAYGSLTFNLAGSITGCGLGLFAGFTGIPRTLTAEQLSMLKTVIKQSCAQFAWHCLIATLGDNHTASLPLLEMLGFVKIHSYNNKNHTSFVTGQPYQQGVYQLDVSKL